MFASVLTQQIVFNGLVQGTVYGLLAMIIVLIYRSSKAINFAVGNMGLVGSALMVLLVVNFGVPYPIALVLGLAVGVLWGALIELAVIRRLFRAPRVIVLVATIGVSQLSIAFIVSLPDLENLGAKYPTPFRGTWQWTDGLQVKAPQLLVLIVAPAIALALAWFLSGTLTGRTVRAAAGNAELARLSGINPKRLSTIVWAIGGLIATMSMMLIGGLDGSAGSLSTVGSASLLRALVAALIARFSSFRVALASAMALGVLDAVVRFNLLESPGVIDALLLLIVLAVVLLRSKERGDDTVFSFNPKVEVMPERLREIFWVRNLDRIAMLAMLAVAVALPFIFTQPSRHVLYASVAAFTICALSLTVLTGWGGQLSLGQMAFAGIGALTAAAFTRGLTVDYSFRSTQILYFRYAPLPFALSIPLAGLVTAAVAALIGFGSLRVRGLLLAVTTFAFAVAAGTWIYRLPVLAGGNGSSVPFKRGELFGMSLKDNRNYYFVVLGVLVLFVALLGRLRRSGVGRVTLAVRDNANSAAAYTTRASVVKLRAFALAGFIAGVGGALLAAVGQRFGYGDARFFVDGSLLLVSMIVIGGMGSVSGAIVGAIWVVGIPSLAPGEPIVALLSSSMGLLILLLYFPGGLANIGYRTRANLYRYLEQKLPPVEKQAAAPPVALHRSTREAVTHDVPLRATDIVVQFGGVRANDGVSLEVRRNEIVGLIGTNGAGKSTLMNAIGGFVPSTGTVELLGQDVSDMPAAVRARHGLGRTFQAATLFPELTVRETVEVALEARGRSSLVETMLFSPRMRRRARSQHSEAAELVDFLGLGRYADRQISELSTGTRRIVELAGLLALDATVLCLDEPTAGIAQREAEAMAPLLVEIRKELGASMLIIEHDMPLIMSMSDRVYCLELGKVIAEGDPSSVRNDPKVIASYLGMDERTIQRSGQAT